MQKTIKHKLNSHFSALQSKALENKSQLNLDNFVCSPEFRWPI
ncbi:hypothetical protein EV06_0031 [Prochlorococcus sp. MIT 0602]|nr:hypothetical protein EV07_1527 [Prochlorococcus sp. MIT 0603]KGG17908.1 hypothetical protein EV06_0031 [Prochlorococcus sp. MIT 0602]